MAENLSCKYLLGMCYSCNKCLYCFTFPQQNRSCKCEKDKQPLRTKNPKYGRQIYQRLFVPDPSFPKSNEYLFDANTRFGYNSNFEESFSYTFCGTCNSQIQRLRKADRENQKAQTQIEENDNEIDALSDLSSEKEVDYGNKNNKEKDQTFLLEELLSSDTDEEKDSNVDDDDNENSDLEEVKLQIIVKSKDIRAPTAKTLIIEPVNYETIMEKINSVVQKTLGKKNKSKNYVISYKAVNARGPSNELEDELDFKEFLNKYKKVILAGKKMSVIVVIQDDVIMKKTSGKKHVKVKYFSVLL